MGVRPSTRGGAVPTKAAIAIVALALALVAAYASSAIFEATVGVKVKVSRPFEAQVEIPVEAPALAIRAGLEVFLLW